MNFSEVYQWNMTLNAWVLIDDACRINEYKTLGIVSPSNFHGQYIFVTSRKFRYSKRHLWPKHIGRIWGICSGMDKIYHCDKPISRTRFDPIEAQVSFVNYFSEWTNFWNCLGLWRRDLSVQQEAKSFCMDLYQARILPIDITMQKLFSN